MPELSLQQKLFDASGDQIFGVVGPSEFPLIWAFADNLLLQLAMGFLILGLLALVFDRLAFRGRVTSFYLSILTQATISLVFFMASAIALGGIPFLRTGHLGQDWLRRKGVRDNEVWVWFLGYHVERYKRFIFTITTVVSGIGVALYYPQAGIICSGQIALITLVYLGFYSINWTDW